MKIQNDHGDGANPISPPITASQIPARCTKG